MILVTGATGHLGQLVIEALLKRVAPNKVIAGVRSLDKGKALAAQGVQLRVVNYDDPVSVESALHGVEKVLLISGTDMGKRAEQHSAVIAAAKKTGVKHLAYTSILKADSSQMILAKEHLATEKDLLGSGLSYTLLRNGWYTENYLGSIAGALHSGAVLGAAGSSRLSPAARVDYAEAAAVVLTTSGHEGKVYELAGDDSWNLSELAAAISKASGKNIEYRNLPEAEYAGVLQSFGVPEGFARALADSDVGITRGELLDTSKTLSKLIGRPTTPLSSVISKALS